MSLIPVQLSFNVERVEWANRQPQACLCDMYCYELPSDVKIRTLTFTSTFKVKRYTPSKWFLVNHCGSNWNLEMFSRGWENGTSREESLSAIGFEHSLFLSPSSGGSEEKRRLHASQSAWARTNNKLNPHIMASPPELKRRSHWLEAIAVITAPPLFPFVY